MERVDFGRGWNKASLVVSLQNSCKEKEKLKVGTWNVRTMTRLEKLTNVIGEMNTASLDILGLAEMSWKDAGDFMNEVVRVI